MVPSAHCTDVGNYPVRLQQGGKSSPKQTAPYSARGFPTGPALLKEIAVRLLQAMPEKASGPRKHQPETQAPCSHHESP